MSRHRCATRRFTLLPGENMGEAATQPPPRIHLIAALIGAICCLTLICATRASAERTHPFTGSFGPEGPLSVTPFASVQGIAVDGSTGDVYVFDAGAAGGSIYKFDAAGNTVDFSALGTNVITGVGGATPDENELAVDSSNGPAKGDIYLANATNVSIYGSNGRRLELGGHPAELNNEVQTDVPGAPWGEPCGVTVDSTGNVYVGLASGQVNKYTPGANPPVNSDYTSSLWDLVGEVCNIAADNEGNVYADTYRSGPVTRYGADQFSATETAATGTQMDAVGSTLAVDPAVGSHALYIDENNLVAEYETTEELNRLGTFGGSGAGAFSGASYGVAGNVAGDVYASNGLGVVDIFGPSEVVPVQIDSESATRVTSTSADLAAQINPAGTQTSYYFEWGAEDCGAQPSACTSTPAAPGTALAVGETDQSAGVHIQDLTPDTTYHYRVVVQTETATISGPDATFQTRSPGGPLNLLDHRAWEMVSPLDKNNALLTGIDGYPTGTVGGLLQASPDGDSIAYASNGAFANPAGAPLSTQYLATRQADGWNTTSMIPPIVSESYFPVGQGGPYKAFSSDLSQGLLLNGENKPIQNARLTEDAPAGYQDFYLQELQQLPHTDFQSILTSPPPGETPTEFALTFEGSTPDLQHMVFSTIAALTPDAIAGQPGHPNLYEWFAGQLRLINILPHETTGTPGAVLGEDSSNHPGGLNAISTDGSRIFFTDEDNLYVNGAAGNTEEVDESQEHLESGDGDFQTASSDGSRVFFTDRRKLTTDSTASSSGLSDLYELDLEDHRLSDLTTADAAGADVQRVLGASADGAYVYFVANGVLAPGASRGSCSTSLAGGGSQRCSLYLWRRATDTTTFIATLSQEDNTEKPLYQFESRGSADDWAPQIQNRTSRVTPDGLNVVFMSQGNLEGFSDFRGYDNHDIETGAPDQEVYDYNAGTGLLSCASCDPTGARPSAAASIPGGTQFELGGAIYQSRVVSDSEAGRARVFFDSGDALVSQDTNGKPDVYEWEEDGRGSCASEAGCVDLISSGASDTESSFADASADGSDVFFLTTSELVKSDTDHLYDLYDARQDGGFSTGPTPPACTGTGCQGVPPTPPIFATPASVTFNGVGNFGIAAKPKPKPLTRAQKLSKALAACHRIRKQKQRASCERQARKRYGTKTKTKTRKAPAEGRK